MRRIIRIIGKESWRKGDKIHNRTYAVLDDGSEVVGYGIDFDVGEKVEVFHDTKWDVVKMRKSIDKLKA